MKNSRTAGTSIPWAVISGRDVAGALDIHHRIPERYFGTISARDIKEHSRLVPFGAGAVRIPNAHLRLVTNLAHDMLHDRGVFSGFAHLRYLIDLIELCADPADPAGWQRVEEKFSHLPVQAGAGIAVPPDPAPVSRSGVSRRPAQPRGLDAGISAGCSGRGCPGLRELEWQMILRLRQTRFWLWLRQPR